MKNIFTKEKIIEGLKSSGTFLKDALIDAFGNAVAELTENAFSEAIEIGISNTIRALYDANVDDNEIIRVVGEHWGISKDEIINRLLREKKEAAIDSLEQYLRLQGNSKHEANELMRQSYAKIYIRNEKELWKLKDNPVELWEKIKEISKEK